jgi:hypothetical protein
MTGIEMQTTPLHQQSSDGLEAGKRPGRLSGGKSNERNQPSNRVSQKAV